MTTGAGIDFTKGCQLSPVISTKGRNLWDSNDEIPHIRSG